MLPSGGTQSCAPILKVSLTVIVRRVRSVMFGELQVSSSTANEVASILPKKSSSRGEPMSSLFQAEAQL